MIGKLLGHKVPATTARYAHLAEDALQRANENLGERLGVLFAEDQEASHERWR